MLTKNDILDIKIDCVKEEIQKIRKSRWNERQRFTENQATLYFQQHQCRQKLNRKLDSNRIANTIVSASCYQNVMKNLTSLSSYCPTYIITKQAKVCEVLHQVEVLSNQLRVLTEHHENIQKFFENFLDQEINKIEVTITKLQQRIDKMSLEISDFQIKNKETLSLRLSLQENFPCPTKKQKGYFKDSLTIMKDFSAFSVVFEFFCFSIPNKNRNTKLSEREPRKISQSRTKFAKAA